MARVESRPLYANLTLYFMQNSLLKLILCTLIFTSINAFSNDSLKQSWQTLKANPTHAFELIQDIDYAKLSTLDKLQYSYLYVASNNLLGHYSESITFIESVKLPQPTNEAEYRQMLDVAIRNAWPYEAVGKFNTALSWYEEAENIAIYLNDIEEQGYVKLQYSAVYMQQGYSTYALNIGKQAQKLLINSTNEGFIADLNSQLGILYYLNDDFSQAIKYQNKVLKQAQKDHSLQEQVVAHYNIANAYHKWGKQTNQEKKHGTAIQHYLTALALAEELGAEYLQRNSLLGLIALHTHTDNLLLANEYTNKLLNIEVSHQGFNALSYHLVLAQYYAKSKQWEEVEPHLNRVIKYYEENTHHLPIYAIGKQKDLADLYATLGQYEHAYYWLDRYSKQMLSAQQRNLDQQVSVLKSELDNKRLQHENSLLSLENHRALSISMIVILVLAITIALLYFQHRKKRLFYKLSNTDFLTGIANRRFIMEEGERLFKRQRLSSIVLDIDHFKSINDHFGHDTGDSVLCEVTKIMQAHLSKGELLGRIGGEEFLLLLPKMSQEDLQNYAERLRKKIESYTFKTHQNQPMQVTASLGLALHNGGSLATQFTRADQALYQAKQQGRNRWILSE